jgi:ribonuclease-3
MSSSLDKLQTLLGYRFSQRSLLETALTHRSFGHSHYERLEFLGDSILGAVIATLLYRRFPALPEGDLSRFRSHLVREDSLHRLAVTIHLGDCLRLGEGEQKSGGKTRASILADALEAVIAAVYLEAGFEGTSLVIEQLFADALDALDGLEISQALKDPKTRLQEWLQARKLPLPDYRLISTSGAAHAQVFHVACNIGGKQALSGNGKGKNRRLAEQNAAHDVLRQLEASVTTAA